MSGFACPHCREMIDMFGSGGGERTAQEAGLAFLGRIPFDGEMVRCGDEGRPFHEAHRDAPATLAFAAIAEKLGKMC
jgi:MinD superfamily P-loop ATPase